MDRIKELNRLSRLRRVWDDSDSPENLTPGLITLCKEWMQPDFTLAEIGSFAGVSTAIFACFVKQVIAVDPFEAYAELDAARLLQGERRFLNTLHRFPNIFHIRERSMVAALEIEDRSLDAVYIDGAHDRLSFIEDVRTWLPKIKLGGLLMGHDWSQIQNHWYAHEAIWRWGEPRVYPEDSWVVKLG